MYIECWKKKKKYKEYEKKGSNNFNSEVENIKSNNFFTLQLYSVFIKNLSIKYNFFFDL